MNVVMMTMPGKFFVAVSATIERDGRILIGKRSPEKVFGPGVWELPSGRIEQGETPRSGLKREMKEELGVDIIGAQEYHSYLIQQPPLPDEIVVICFACQIPSDQIPIRSKEHVELKWVTPTEFLNEYASFPTQKEEIRHYLKIRPLLENL